MLDTNIVSDMIRNPAGRVSAKIREVGQAQVCTSIIVAAELRYGAIKKRAAKLSARIQAVLSILEVDRSGRRRTPFTVSFACGSKAKGE